MHNETLNHISHRMVRQAEALGADLAGIAAVKDVKHSPSHRISPRMPRFEGVGTKPVDGQPPGIVQWPQGANSAVVIAIAHPVDRPELDWWVTGASSGNTEGNRRLMAVVDKLAVLAALGCIGRNNLLISPQYGTRLRLRVMLIDADLPATGPVDFDPCADCSGPCRKACPQKAFDRPRYSAEAYGQSELPGRSGVFDRWACNRQMEQDNADYETVTLAGEPAPARRVRYCRRCELTCPAGRPLRAK
jgi:epoxyqueuosine reductase